MLTKIPKPSGFGIFCIKKTTRYTSGSKKPMAMNKKTLLRQLNGPPTAQLYITGILYHGNNDTVNYSRQYKEKSNKIYSGMQCEIIGNRLWSVTLRE